MLERWHSRFKCPTPPHPGRVQISHPGHGGQPNSLGLPVGGMLKLRINLCSSTIHEQG